MQPKITLTPKQIAIIVYIIAILGLFASIIPIIFPLDPYNYSRVYWDFLGYSHSFYPSFMGWNLTINISNNDNSSTSIYYLPTVFYIILLFGVFVYDYSKTKETRIIRATLSIILIANIVYFINSLTFSYRYSTNGAFSYISWIIQIIDNALTAALAYFTLISLHKTKTLDITYKESFAKPILNTVNKASLWERLVNFMLDNIICVVIFSDFIILFSGNGTNADLYFKIWFVVARIVYFTFFEALLGATPAKLLTETRVIDDIGAKLTFGTTFGRTLARHIPLEPLSFLGKRGWHDSLSETVVVKEVPTGIKGQRYLLIIPFFITLGLSIYYGKMIYASYQSNQYNTRMYEHKITQIKKKLQNLSTNDVIELESATQGAMNEVFFLKIEKIEGDNIKVALITDKSYKIRDMRMLENIYNNGEVVEQKDIQKAEKIDDTEDFYMLAQFPLYSIKRSDLNNAYTDDYDDHERLKRKGINFLGDDQKFAIKEIERLSYPIIKLQTGNAYKKDINLNVYNCGLAGTITEIQNIEGNIKWTTELPKIIELKNQYADIIQIQGMVIQEADKYKFKMIVLDEKKRKQTYLIQGKDHEFTMELLD